MGIANIVNTAGGGGGSSEIITHLVNSVDGAGLRLANQGYISCAHVSANKFGTNDFSVEFVLSQETNAVNADIFISNLNGSNQAVDAAVIRWDVVQNDNIQLVFTNSGAAETAYNFGYDPAPDLNEPTHYLVSADRSGNAVLYRNGAEIASVSIAASGSANVGNSGQPTVIGSPVNNFGVKGNVYRLRTYSKALSSDEAKNVFDRADVPTALVSNLLLDLDCAYANPTQSTVIQDRGPNNQDGTLNGTITQTNVIKQLNSTSARIGTTGASPADGEVIADKVKIGTESFTPHASVDDLVVAPSDVAAGMTIRAGSNSGTSRIAFADLASTTVGLITYDHNTDNLTLAADDDVVLSSGAGTGSLTIDSSGRVGVGVSPGAKLHVSSGTTNNIADDLSEVRFIGSDKAITGEQANLVVQTNDDVAANKGGSIGLGGRHTTSSTNGANFAQISGRKENATSANFAGYLAFSTSDAASDIHERMRITSTGNVQIGTGSLAAVGGGPTLGLVGAAPEITLRDSATGTPYAVMRTNDNGNLILEADSGDDAASSQIEFKVDGATAATIDSSGNALFNTTVTNPGNGNTNTGASILATGRMHLSSAFDHTVNRSSDGNVFEFRRSNTAVGSIAVTTSATAFNTSSDYRLKENLTPLTGALDRLDALPVYRFNFKADPDTTVDGFVAHEVQAHVPEAVTGEKDAMKTVVVQEAVEAVEAQPATYYEEGDELPEGVAVGDEKTAAVEAVEAVEEVTEEQIDPQGIDQSKLVPLLVAAVKELKAKVETLENA